MVKTLSDEAINEFLIEDLGHRLAPCQPILVGFQADPELSVHSLVVRTGRASVKHRRRKSPAGRGLRQQKQGEVAL